eukprot:scaffold65807_cov21-Tisochrysis_lutea.AAC.1
MVGTHMLSKQPSQGALDDSLPTCMKPYPTPDSHTYQLEQQTRLCKPQRSMQPVCQCVFTYRCKYSARCIFCPFSHVQTEFKGPVKYHAKMFE